MLTAIPSIKGATDAPLATPLLAPAAPAQAGPRLADALGGMATGAVETLRGAEAAAAGAMTGQVTTREAVDRVMEAERTLRAAVAVRDKLVSGWLDISRMQI